MSCRSTSFIPGRNSSFFPGRNVDAYGIGILRCQDMLKIVCAGAPAAYSERRIVI